MRATAPIEGIARRRVALPQRVVGLAVQSADGAPLLEDDAHPVACRLPLAGVDGEILGFGGQRLLAGGLRRAMFLAAGAIGRRRLLGMLGNHGQSGRQDVDVTENVCRGERFGQCGRGGLDLAGIAAAGRQPGLHQGDLGGEVVESPAEVGEGGVGFAGLPRADYPLTGGGDEIDRAVVSDAAEAPWVAGGNRRGVRGCGRTGHRPRRSRAGPGPGRRADGRLADRLGGGLFGLGFVAGHGPHLPSARCSRAPAALSGAVALRPATARPATTGIEPVRRSGCPPVGMCTRRPAGAAGNLAGRPEGSALVARAGPESVGG